MVLPSARCAYRLFLPCSIKSPHWAANSTWILGRTACNSMSFSWMPLGVSAISSLLSGRWLWPHLRTGTVSSCFQPKVSDRVETSPLQPSVFRVCHHSGPWAPTRRAHYALLVGICGIFGFYSYKLLHVPSTNQLWRLEMTLAGSSQEWSTSCPSFHLQLPSHPWDQMPNRKILHGERVFWLRFLVLWWKR